MNIHSQHELELKNGLRFDFGENWTRFLTKLTEDKIIVAENSLKFMLNINSFEGRTFLDVGSGSGLFSLAARRLGAKVVSFDYDPKSVSCTKELKKRYFNDDENWKILEGSILDNDFINSLGEFDFVYSWGVLHHTGSMWNSLNNVVSCVKKGGSLFIAIYNYQQFFSRYWLFVKKIYNKYFFLKPFIVFMHFIYPTAPSMLYKYFKGRRDLRGMNEWYDLIDWLGGFPFEVAKPEEILDFYLYKDFSLKKLKTVEGKHGCCEYVFTRF